MRVERNGRVKIDAREGYYADRDFSHTGKRDRELQLQEQLAADLVDGSASVRDRRLVQTCGGALLRPGFDRDPWHGCSSRGQPRNTCS